MPDPSGVAGAADTAIAVTCSTSVAGTTSAVSGPGGITGVLGAGAVRGIPHSRAEAMPGVPDSGGGVMKTFTNLLKVQTDVMAAQAKAAAVHNLPALSCYTGEDGDTVDDGFDRWVERFRERAAFANWSREEQLYQLKLHLDRCVPDVATTRTSNYRQCYPGLEEALQAR